MFILKRMKLNVIRNDPKRWVLTMPWNHVIFFWVSSSHKSCQTLCLWSLVSRVQLILTVLYDSLTPSTVSPLRTSLVHVADDALAALNCSTSNRKDAVECQSWTLSENEMNILKERESIFVISELCTWPRTAFVNELGLGRTQVDLDLDLLDAEFFQSRHWTRIQHCDIIC